jgi:nucleoside-diphosphate-sugar epimerase
MKKILITGANSYVGTNVEKWLMQEPDKYYVETLDMKQSNWKDFDFSKFDVVFHVAGIAHIKEAKKNKDIYYIVNKDLSYETAKKAKSDKVRQFIFLSSMSVYGIDKGVIDEDTIPNPKSAYGKSKFEAEKLISKLQDESFNVSIIRPPMVYGKGCKGNYPRLVRFVLKTPFFPRINNKRSMIYIDNLSEFIKQVINNHSVGLFFPQNAEYVNISEMVSLIAYSHGKKLRFTKVINPILRILKTDMINKIFGDLVYEMHMSRYIKDYRVCNFKDSINKAEGGKQ